MAAAEVWDGPMIAERGPREPACNDANRLVGKLESALKALDGMQLDRGAPESMNRLQTAEPGLLDALDRAHHLASQLDRRAHELTELIGRL